jgi:hypothetical protein
MRARIVLEWDENDLSEGWMNIDNLEYLLYTDACTKRDLLKIVSYEDGDPHKKQYPEESNERA